MVIIYLRFGLYFLSHHNFVDTFELWVEYLQHHLFQRSVVKYLCSDYQIGLIDPKKKQEKEITLDLGLEINLLSIPFHNYVHIHTFTSITKGQNCTCS